MISDEDIFCNILHYTIQRNIAWSEYATATAPSVPASDGMFQEVGYMTSIYIELIRAN